MQKSFVKKTFLGGFLFLSISLGYEVKIPFVNLKQGSYIEIGNLASKKTVEIEFKVKPTNRKSQVWFGGFCGPDGRGGILIMLWHNIIQVKIGNSCLERYPSEYIEWEFPGSYIKLNEWNSIKLIYIPGKFFYVKINNLEKKTTFNVPKYIVSNPIYLGTDSRMPGEHYNFNGYFKDFKLFINK